MATVGDLYRLPHHQKAELVRGELVVMSPTGDLPSSAAGEIFVAVRDYARRTGTGRAYTENAAFLVRLPHRRSFSPDVAFYVGPRAGGRFLEGAPRFAVEVRSESDYGPQAEKARAEKRGDYFAAGTQVVWDVDVLREERVLVYRASDPEHPAVYCRGKIAEAEPALPGWRVAVDTLFE
ncbi:MAG TPA: Uma2 family endonuclease [Thermoanaerobaculia bacterium]|jgi:Uma2 family endonuclease|nr:Uma2 family endonuclease [Thermoanaerobaculia bacterium]